MRIREVSIPSARPKGQELPRATDGTKAREQPKNYSPEDDETREHAGRRI